MTWLARLCLPLAEALRRNLRDSHDWHQLSWQCFPNAPDADRDFLTRLDFENDICRLYVLSRREPQKPQWCQSEWWACKPVGTQFLDHDVYFFDLLVNPTRKVLAFTPEGERKKNSRRMAIIGHEAQCAWLADKGQRHGFTVQETPPVEIVATREQRFTKQQQHGLHVGVRFRGLLRVHDREAFKTVFHQGLGSARAFGFGMLLLQPVLSA